MTKFIISIILFSHSNIIFGQDTTSCLQTNIESNYENEKQIAGRKILDGQREILIGQIDTVLSNVNDEDGNNLRFPLETLSFNLYLDSLGFLIKCEVVNVLNEYRSMKRKEISDSVKQLISKKILNILKLDNNYNKGFERRNLIMSFTVTILTDFDGKVYRIDTYTSPY